MASFCKSFKHGYWSIKINSSFKRSNCFVLKKHHQNEIIIYKIKKKVSKINKKIIRIIKNNWIEWRWRINIAVTTALIINIISSIIKKTRWKNHKSDSIKTRGNDNF